MLKTFTSTIYINIFSNSITPSLKIKGTKTIIIYQEQYILNNFNLDFSSTFDIYSCGFEVYASLSVLTFQSNYLNITQSKYLIR